MATTDLNQLFNQLLPMLLYASQRRRQDNLNERKFEAQQQQGTQDRAKEERRHQEGILRQDLEDKQNRSNDVYKTYLNAPLEHKKMMLESDVDIGGINKTAALQSVGARLIKQEQDRNRDIRKDEAAIRSSDSLVKSREDMFTGMSPSDIANFEFWEGRVEFAETNEQAEARHRQALTYLPKTDTKPYTGTKLSSMVNRVKSMNPNLVGENYDINAGAWFESMRTIDPQMTAEDMDAVLDKLEVDNPFTPLKKTKKAPPLPTARFGGGFQAGARAAERTKSLIPQFIKGFRGFDVESFRK